MGGRPTAAVANLSRHSSIFCCIFTPVGLVLDTIMQQNPCAVGVLDGFYFSMGKHEND
jgi:hypothetical protein